MCLSIWNLPLKRNRLSLTNLKNGGPTILVNWDVLISEVKFSHLMLGKSWFGDRCKLRWLFKRDEKKPKGGVQFFIFFPRMLLSTPALTICLITKKVNAWTLGRYKTCKLSVQLALFLCCLSCLLGERQWHNAHLKFLKPRNKDPKS